MSGGSLNYLYSQILLELDQIPERSPLLRAFKAHLEDVAMALKALEWYLSGDTDWESAREEIEPVVPTETSLEQVRQDIENLLTELRRLQEAAEDGRQPTD